VAGSVWLWILNQRKKLAETKATVAESEAARGVADAQGTVYKLITDRLTRLETEVTEVRAELAEERKHSRQLEQKVAALEAWIRAQGLTPPSL